MNMLAHPNADRGSHCGTPLMVAHLECISLNITLLLCFELLALSVKCRLGFRVMQ